MPDKKRKHIKTISLLALAAMLTGCSDAGTGGSVHPAAPEAQAENTVRVKNASFNIEDRFYAVAREDIPDLSSALTALEKTNVPRPDGGSAWRLSLDSGQSYTCISTPNGNFITDTDGNVYNGSEALDKLAQKSCVIKSAAIVDNISESPYKRADTSVVSASLLGKYPTFYDFARRSDLDEATEAGFVPYGDVTVSKNLTMRKNGEEIHVDVYAFDTDAEDAETVTADLDKRSYSDKEGGIYSTGVYFTDNGTATLSIQTPRDFKLTFDDYNGDGNPDYCMKYMSDANGTHYVLNNISDDGRVLNLSGRAYEGGIYVAGCFDVSPRLQKYTNTPFIGWKLENNTYIPVDEAGNTVELPPLNMYSERFYMPDGLSFYLKNENTVHCFLWNNTPTEVTTDAAYGITKYDPAAHRWETVGGGTTDPVVIQPRCCADIAYDISCVTGDTATNYRIVQNCGDLTAFGDFMTLR